MNGRVLIAAGSDSSGGAGIQADIKTVAALGAYSATAVTAVTVQTTEGVSRVFLLPPDLIAGQLDAVLGDIGADCIKLGMLGSAEIVRAVAQVVARHPDIPLVVDPVMVATSGDLLLDQDAVELLKTEIIPRASAVTPNAHEAAVLTGLPVESVQEFEAAARAILALGAGAVIVTGGDMAGDTVTDIFATGDAVEFLSAPRLDTTSTHGTGCTFASAIAAGLAQNMTVRAAVVRAQAYVREAIRTAPGHGRGHGPLNHGHNIPEFRYQA